MQLTDRAREVPNEVWTLFAPRLPPGGWCGNGCPPYGNREGRHAVLHVWITGRGGRLLPPGFASYQLVHWRLKV
jgi:hypothetical protein